MPRGISLAPQARAVNKDALSQEMKLSLFEYPSVMREAARPQAHGGSGGTPLGHGADGDGGGSSSGIFSSLRRKMRRTPATPAVQVRVFDEEGNLTSRQSGVHVLHLKRKTFFFFLRSLSWTSLLSFSLVVYLLILISISTVYFVWGKACGAVDTTVVNAFYFTVVSLAANGGYMGEDVDTMGDPSHMCYSGRTLIVMFCSYANILFVGLVAALVVGKAEYTGPLANRIEFSDLCTLVRVPGRIDAWRLAFRMANLENKKPLAHGQLRLFVVAAEPLKEYKMARRERRRHKRQLKAMEWEMREFLQGKASAASPPAAAPLTAELLEKKGAPLSNTSFSAAAVAMAEDPTTHAIQNFKRRLARDQERERERQKEERRRAKQQQKRRDEEKRARRRRGTTAQPLGAADRDEARKRRHTVEGEGEETVVDIADKPFSESGAGRAVPSPPLEGRQARGQRGRPRGGHGHSGTNSRSPPAGGGDGGDERSRSDPRRGTDADGNEEDETKGRDVAGGKPHSSVSRRRQRCARAVPSLQTASSSRSRNRSASGSSRRSRDDSASSSARSSASSLSSASSSTSTVSRTSSTNYSAKTNSSVQRSSLHSPGLRLGGGGAERMNSFTDLPRYGSGGDAGATGGYGTQSLSRGATDVFGSPVRKSTGSLGPPTSSRLPPTTAAAADERTRLVSGEAAVKEAKAKKGKSSGGVGRHRAGAKGARGNGGDGEDDDDDDADDVDASDYVERVHINVSELDWVAPGESYRNKEDGQLSLWYPATIVHTIDERSPLYRFMDIPRVGAPLGSHASSTDFLQTTPSSSRGLSSRRFQIVAVFDATEMETGATIMAKHTYTTTDIVTHYKFSNKLIHMNPESGEVLLDYHYFNELLPVTAVESSTTDSEV